MSRKNGNSVLEVLVMSERNRKETIEDEDRDMDDMDDMKGMQDDQKNNEGRKGGAGGTNKESGNASHTSVKTGTSGAEQRSRPPQKKK